MNRGIRISEKHGVNPSVGVCFFCGEEDGTVILAGRLTGDAEAPRRAVWSHDPCPKCKEHMKAGIVLISVDPARSPDHANPWRTGGWCVVKEEAFRRLFSGPPVETSLKLRFAFVEDAVWDRVGLPRAGAEKA